MVARLFHLVFQILTLKGKYTVHEIITIFIAQYGSFCYKTFFRFETTQEVCYQDLFGQGQEQDRRAPTLFKATFSGGQISYLSEGASMQAKRNKAFRTKNFRIPCY